MEEVEEEIHKESKISKEKFIEQKCGNGENIEQKIKMNRKDSPNYKEDIEFVGEGRGEDTGDFININYLCIFIEFRSILLIPHFLFNFIL